MSLILIVILILLLFGGAGYGRYGGNVSFGAGYGNSLGIVGIVLLVVLIVMLLGGRV